MGYLETLVLVIVEGVTEFLPVSSTGHLILTSHILKIPQTEFLKSFEIIIQLGAILAVVVLYWRRLLTDFESLKRILLAFIPSAVLGFIFYDFIKGVLFENILVTVTALFLGGVAFILLEKFYFKEDRGLDDVNKLSYKKLLLIGIFQAISMIPGVSRAGSTIFGGLFAGLSRKTAVEFSFLLAVPTMMAATGLDILETNLNYSLSELGMLGVGLLGSFIVALLVIKWFLKYIQSHTFIAFGVYRIILAIVFYLFFLY
ncbi:MAG: undecaprenyl-diphosphate phosphatase [Candidatus Daviesbacteria bacterium]|nr:undecaprenyl-diphosphate phosphatase [Candidatus Daviesbacteria bacterium]